MQERWSASNAKLVQVEDGLLQDGQYFPEKNDANAKKNYVKSSACIKVLLVLLLLCLVGLSSYLVWQTPGHSVDDSNEDIPQNKKLFRSIEDQSIPADDEDSSWYKVSESDTSVSTEAQQDDSIYNNDPASNMFEHTTHTADVNENNENNENITAQIFTEIERLHVVDSSSDSNSNEGIATDATLSSTEREIILSFLVKLALRDAIARYKQTEQEIKYIWKEETKTPEIEETQTSEIEGTTEMASDAYDSAKYYSNEDYFDYGDSSEYAQDRMDKSSLPWWELGPPTSWDFPAGHNLMEEGYVR